MSFVGLNMPIIVAFLSYSALMLFIGFYFFQKYNSTASDYFLGERKMGAFVSALSAGASDMSGWLLMGLPGALFVSGFINVYMALGLSIGALLNWLIVAKRLRIYTSLTQAITIPDYFEARFDDKSHILRIICAFVILIFFTFYVSAGLVSGAKLFESTFGLGYTYALSIGTLIIVLYTFFGGYRAVCWTDVTQGLLMMGSLMVVFIVMLQTIGGFSEAKKYITNADSARFNLISYQKEIPNIINELKQIDSSNLGYDKNILIRLINNPLINELQKAKDLNFKLESSVTITSSELILKLESSIKEANIDEIITLLNVIYETKLVSHSHLNFIDGVSIFGIISMLAWGLGYFGQPHILVRFMSINSIKDIKKASFIGISWMVLSLFFACGVGILGVAFVNKFNLALDDPEKIFIVISQVLFNPWVAGVLLSAILAAIMSTASSQLLVSSSTIAEDFYKRIFKTDASDKSIVFMGRLGVLVISLIAFSISTNKDSSILSIVSYAWAGFGASFGSVILFSLFYEKMTRLGAIAGMLSGAIVVVVWNKFIYEFIPIYEILPGFLIASFSIILFSSMESKNDKSREVFKTMQKEL